jgi:hypothetical protein
MRRTAYVFLALLVLADASLRCPIAAVPATTSHNQAQTSTRAPISGLTTMNSVDAERVGKLFDTSNPTLNAYANPNTKGVTFRTSWADVEPADGTYDFSKLDTVFANAEKNGKWVALILIPGFGTPSWALKGVQTVSMPIRYGAGSLSGTPLPLPVPWDSTYLTRWFAFLQAIGNRYESHASFRMIAAAGPTSVSAEMSLPDSPDDLIQWKNAGYTSQKYEDAWKQTFSAYASTFPNQYFSLALYPGLPIPHKGERTATREKVIGLGMQYPSQFALEEDGLNANKSTTMFGYTTVMANIGQATTGFGMTTSAMLKPQNMGAAGNPPLALRESIDLGMVPNAADQRVNFLQIYEPDVTAQEMQSTLQYGASLFGPSKPPTPTRPHGVHGSTPP